MRTLLFLLTWSVVQYERTGGSTPLAESINRFGLNLLATLQYRETWNTVFSPLSISMSCGILEAGSENGTADQIAEVLGFYRHKANYHLHYFFYNILRTLRALDRRHNFSWKNGNLLMYAKKFKVLQSFVDKVEQQYFGSVTSENFHNKKHKKLIVNAMNKWSSVMSNNTIQTVLNGPIHSKALLMIFNVVYFKGTWRTSFEMKQTLFQFTNSNGKKVRVHIMKKEEELYYVRANHLHLQMVEVPYEREISLYLVLPDYYDGMKKLIHNLSYDQLDKLIQEMYLTKVKLFMPKFLLHGGLDLEKILPKMGLTLPFSKKEAHFRKMSWTKKHLAVSHMIHKAALEVNQDGAYKTNIDEKGHISEGPKEPILAANRPFFFIIRDKKLGVDLFMGTITTLKDESQERSDDGSNF